MLPHSTAGATKQRLQSDAQCGNDRRLRPVPEGNASKGLKTTDCHQSLSALAAFLLLGSRIRPRAGSILDVRHEAFDPTR